MTSIIICFYERLQHLQYCLESLKFSKEDFDEVVISDDGSSPETVEGLNKLIENYDFPIRHIWQAKKGFRVAASRNNGIRNARGDYLIFFDCDFLILPGTVKEHTKRAQKGRFIAGNCKYLSESQTKNTFSKPLQSHSLKELYNNLPVGNLKKEHRKCSIKTHMFFKMIRKGNSLPFHGISGLFPIFKIQGFHFSIPLIQIKETHKHTKPVLSL